MTQVFTQIHAIKKYWIIYGFSQKKKFLGEEFLSCRKVLSHAFFGIEKN